MSKENEYIKQRDKNVERCICCGEPIPEGKIACYNCLHSKDKKDEKE